MGQSEVPSPQTCDGPPMRSNEAASSVLTDGSIRSLSVVCDVNRMLLCGMKWHWVNVSEIEITCNLIAACLSCDRFQFN